jgi:hypothetical protein
VYVCVGVGVGVSVCVYVCVGVGVSVGRKPIHKAWTLVDITREAIKYV